MAMNDAIEIAKSFSGGPLLMGAFRSLITQLMRKREEVEQDLDVRSSLDK